MSLRVLLRRAVLAAVSLAPLMGHGQSFVDTPRVVVGNLEATIQVWDRAGVDQQNIFGQLSAYCNMLPGKGWRMPTREEVLRINPWQHPKLVPAPSSKPDEHYYQATISKIWVDHDPGRNNSNVDRDVAARFDGRQVVFEKQGREDSLQHTMCVRRSAIAEAEKQRPADVWSTKHTPMLTLTRPPDPKPYVPTAEDRAAWAKEQSERNAATERFAKEDARRAVEAAQMKMAHRASCMPPNRRGDCDCLSYYPRDPERKTCGK